MRVLARVVAFAALVGAALPAPVPARLDTPTPQVQIEAKIVEASDNFAREIGVFWRAGADGKPDLLLALPSRVDGKPIDGAEVSLGQGSAREFRPSLLPQGWKFDARKETMSFAGPALGATQPIAIALDAAAGVKLAVAPRVRLGSGGSIVLDIQPELRTLAAVRTVTDISSVLRLPQRFSPGDTLWFSPLDPKLTPGGGSWRIGGLDAQWNGDFDRPGYTVKIPESFAASGKRPLDVSYIDLWKTELVDGKATDLLVLVRPTLVGEVTGGGRPAVTGCSPAALSGNPYCLCGNFPEGSAAELLINGQSIGQYLVSSSPTILNLVLPDGFAAGPLTPDASSISGFDIADGARGVLIHVGGEIDRNKLKRGQATSLKLWLDGTDRPIDLRLWNSTPGIVSLAGGNDQVVTTSGGRPNQVTRTVNAVSPGDFALHYELTVDSCPCAGESAEEPESPDQPDDDYNDGPPQYEVGDDYQELIAWNVIPTWRRKLAAWLEQTRGLTTRDEVTDAIADAIQREVEALDRFLEEIRPRIEQYQREARNYSKYEFLFPKRQIAEYQELRRIVSQLVFLDGRLTLLPRAGQGDGTTDDCLARAGDCDSLRQQAEAAEAEARKLRGEAEQLSRPRDAYRAENSQLAVLRRQAAAYRELEQSALGRVAKSAARAKANPGKGYERDLASAQQDAAGYAADAAKLEAQAKGLELEIARDSVMADFFREQAEAAERAAAAAEQRAIAARQAYEACLDAAIDACDETPATGGGGSTQEKPPTVTPPGSPKEPPGGRTPEEEKPKSPGPVEPKVSSSTPRPNESGSSTDQGPRPRLCGPDLGPAFESSLLRVARRVRALPASEFGFVGGGRFLDRNWPYDWVQPRNEDGSPDFSREEDWKWGDLIEWSNGAWSDDCNSCPECKDTNWLWGHCFSSDFIAHLFEDFVREIFRTRLLLVAQGAGAAAAAPDSSADPALALAQPLADLLDPRSSQPADAAQRELQQHALRAAFEAAFAKLGVGSELRWGASCEKCGDWTRSSFAEDWSEEDWMLSDGTLQYPGGTIVKGWIKLVQKIE